MSITAPTETTLADGAVLVSLHDGVFSAPADILIDQASEEATAALRAQYPDGMSINVNAFLLRRPGGVEGAGELILIDAGCGTVYGPAMGHVAATLESIGVAPGDITTVLVTHPHADHIGGLLADDGEALRYPAATVYCPAIDVRHFGGPPTDGENPNRATARRLFALLGDRMHEYGPGAVLPGIEAVSLPGHTPGHSGFLIGEEVLIWADTLHVMERQPERPEIGVTFDEDRALATATRREAMALAASKGWIVGGMHLPIPGLARVTAEGDAFRMVSLPTAA